MRGYGHFPLGVITDRAHFRSRTKPARPSRRHFPPGSPFALPPGHRASWNSPPGSPTSRHVAAFSLALNQSNRLVIGDQRPKEMTSYEVGIGPDRAKGFRDWIGSGAVVTLKYGTH